jgi:endonuclease-8
MPEGDTLLRTARTLARALVGKRIVRFVSPLAALARAALEGRHVVTSEARGKNLILTFDDGRALHSHMRMTGSWHLYRPGERWQRPPYVARAEIEVEATGGDPALIAVCFDAPVVRLLRAGEVDIDERIQALGPDILKDDFDEAEAVRRLRARAGVPLGEAIVDQRAVAGIGNIYKSETLFACGLDPFAPVSAFDDEALVKVVREARRLMRKNLAPGEGRVTFDIARGGIFAVYDRSGQTCFRCGTKIAMKRQGELHRSTYYCSGCQAPR